MIKKLFPHITNLPSPLLVLSLSSVSDGWAGGDMLMTQLLFGVFQHASATRKARWARCATRWRGSAPAARTSMGSAAAGACLGILGFPTAAHARVMATQSFATRWPATASTAAGLRLEAAVKGKVMGGTAPLTPKAALWIAYFSETCPICRLVSFPYDQQMTSSTCFHLCLKQCSFFSFISLQNYQRVQHGRQN